MWGGWPWPKATAGWGVGAPQTEQKKLKSEYQSRAGVRRQRLRRLAAAGKGPHRGSRAEKGAALDHRRGAEGVRGGSDRRGPPRRRPGRELPDGWADLAPTAGRGAERKASR